MEGGGEERATWRPCVTASDGCLTPTHCNCDSGTKRCNVHMATGCVAPGVAQGCWCLAQSASLVIIILALPPRLPDLPGAPGAALLQTWMLPVSPVDSMREAVLTVSPNRQ